MSTLRIPLATYRLQFNHRFTFKQASEFISYFNDLGISDLYASPFMKSNPGSIHGYDVLDPCQLNPEIGTSEEVETIVKQLKKFQMGLILDIVPNHMSIAGSSNKWWQDVLENGPSSIYAKLFNIIWNPPKVELKNKVLLAILEQQYGKVIENQELKIVYALGSFFVEYKRLRLPVNPRTWPIILNPVVHQLLTFELSNDPDILELQSIITALDHLPPITETDAEKCKERHRENEIIKKRLSALVDKVPGMHEAIQFSMNALNGEKGNPHSFDRLENLLDAQAYRLSFWRVSNEEINYRRFFDINTLISLCVENKEVFDVIHELIFEFVKKGWVTGFRIDHVDGLYNPQQYFDRLQHALSQLHNEPFDPLKRQFYLIVEKILGGNEQLRQQWLVFGTTGYDYLNLLNGLFVVKENEDRVKQIYDQFIGRHEEFENLFYVCKKMVLIISMSSELNILVRHLEEVCEQHRWSRDFTIETVRTALRDVIACFPVYRSYLRIEDLKVEEEDRQSILAAIQQAKGRNPASDPSIFDFIQSVLLFEDPPGLTKEQIHHRRNFVMHFQQLTGPVTAKGVEDTALYRYYPLASLNEVGMDGKYFGIDIEFFHHRNIERLQKWPYTLLATSTHDTKRSEDVRARINVLSENPQEWREVLYRWHSLNQSIKIMLENKIVPSNNEEYLIYQTLIGTWPLYPMDASTRAQYIDRIKKYLVKALKEAKVHTSWIYENIPYEEGVQEFIDRILSPDPDNHFLKDFENYIKPIVKAGLFNSLSQTLLKMTTPGIPDFYQGSELWEFTLVDPDNRSPVDYSNRKHILSMLKEKAVQDPGLLISHLMETPEDGRIKLYLTSQILNYRLLHNKLFLEGEYHPLVTSGEKAEHAIAFSRHKDNQHIIVAVGRFYLELSRSGNPLGNIWGNTVIDLPVEGEAIYRDILSGQMFYLNKNQLSLTNVFSKLPLALLEKV